MISIFARYLIVIMYNPKDFIPAKYRKVTDQVGSSSDGLGQTKDDDKADSPWSDLAKEPSTPEYRSNVTLGENGIKSEINASIKLDELKEISQEQQKPSSLNLKKKPSNKKKLTGLLMVFFLVIGVFASYMLSKQNQDNRQQASVGDPYECNPGDDDCICAYDGSELRCRKDLDYDCGTSMHLVDGQCMHETCRKLSNGNILCGYITDQDACTEESMGGDWCDNPNTSRVENCEESGLMRCQCSAGWWVIGKAPSCSNLCGDANADCDDCPTTPSPTPTQPPGEPTAPPTASPTPPAEQLACGEFGCNQNSDCKDGLTCQTITVLKEGIKKICAKGESQLFCAANPTTENCCTSQPMPVCASIEMLDANNNLMTNDDDKNLKEGDEVRFRCSAVGNQDVDFDYQFRIWAPGEDYWKVITDQTGTVAKNVSGSYVIAKTGKHVVQGRICWGADCQVWETVEGAPEFSNVTAQSITPCTTNSACEEGYVCSATPAGGCPTITVNGETAMSACASAPFCRLAEGIICTADDDCFDGYRCYQPPQPDCLPGATTCPKVKPSYCVKDNRCSTDIDCEAWQTCYQPPMPECPEGSYCTQSMPAKYCQDLAD